jgi:hypothetical protein
LKKYILSNIKTKGKERVLYPLLPNHLTTPKWLVT